MDENVKYANFLRSKIVKYFNLKNDELDINYIISILNCKSYDLYDSIFLLNESFYEQNKNTKCSSLSNVKKFTQDLVNSKKKFFSSSDANLDSPDKNFLLSNSNDIKTVGTCFQDIFENDKTINLAVNTYQNNISSHIKKNEIKPNEHFTNDFKQVLLESKRKNNNGKNKKIFDDNNKHINKNEYNDEVKNNIFQNDIIKQQNNLIKNHFINEHFINDHSMLDIEKTNEQLKLEKDIKNQKNQKNQNSEQKSNDNKREDNYFSFFNAKENNYSLKEAINFIENENNVVKYNNEQNVKEKKKKNLQICICNGQNHKIYANCLYCGKIYCTKIKYKNCIFCENQLYKSHIINNLFFQSPQNNNNNNTKKLISSVKSSNNFLYKYYFNTNNSYLKKAFELRDKMLKNSINEEQTRVIDDSIDWFEDDIKNEFNNQSIHFSHYDDEIKNEIINKYHEIFGKRFNEINIDIDLVNMKITENKDFLKIKEFNDYLNEKEKEYQTYLEHKKQQDINFNNARNYLSAKEKKNLTYINDLKKIFFKENAVKNDTKLNNVAQSYKCDKPTNYKSNKKYKCNVISIADEEQEDTPS
ncbi:hypothetical protein PFTANZ_04587 [Plasmodium falciparum Tanzania (2000708)]|uniref:TRIP4/RQT4 C2HC5-type zinc finger domain-containing protein n=2 Tax=Plasmodium falciparum TaxID=5833 RepID=A0A024W284_PLAFA|nr:hypothetical protein PFTANZ_04587 [Plasmodium falciparum Tanzania (2000708)]KOB85514.1 hypothetical protein PFDG_00956 [Plasmodium falciparum Dd2]